MLIVSQALMDLHSITNWIKLAAELEWSQISAHSDATRTFINFIQYFMRQVHAHSVKLCEIYLATTCFFFFLPERVIFTVLFIII